MNGKKILSEANITFCQREREYGSAKPLFDDLAKRWSLVLSVDVTPSQVIQCMIELKLARLKQNPNHADSILDIAGYAACLAEVNE